MNKFHAIRDFLWVLQAFLRGKILHQKIYRPQGSFFRPPGPASVRRIRMLMEWWRFRPATKDELIAFWNAAGRNDKRDTLVSFDPKATEEHIRSVRATAHGDPPYDSAANFYCDVLYYNGVSLEEQQWGRGEGNPNFGILSCKWGRHRFLAVHQ